MRGARAALALLGVAVALGASGCGDNGSVGSGELRWEAEPDVVTPENLPEDRIATGTIRNDSLREIELTARDLRLLDEGGDEVRSNAVFLEHFGRSYYDISREPLSEEERLRIGLDARLRPGQVTPLTVAWSEADGGAPASVVDYGDGTLPLP